MWNRLPREERSLYNPAFLGLLLLRAATGHESQVDKPIPIPLAMLAASTSLNRPVRAAMPTRVNSNLVGWLQDHPDFRVTLPRYTAALAPALRASLWLVLSQNLASVVDGIGLQVDRDLSSVPSRSTDAEVRQCEAAAFFAGRWFGRSGSPSTVLALWGVTP